MEQEESGRQLNNLMVDRFKENGRITSQRVEAAFRAVVRHRFMPRELSFDEIYEDQAITLKAATSPGIVRLGSPRSSATMPSLLAALLEFATPEPGERVLQIGTGPGYLVALIAYLVGESGTVVTVELDPEIGGAAKARHRAAGYANIRFVTGDGYFGDAEHAPYDKVVATCSCADIPRGWVEQLSDDGSIVLPFALSQHTGLYPMVGFRRRGAVLDGRVVPSLPAVGFLPLHGPSVTYPVIYESGVTEVQRTIGARLFHDSEDRSTKTGLYMVAMLVLADEIARGTEIESIDADRTYETAVHTWQNAGRPTVDRFSLHLAPKSRAPRESLWRFDKHDHTLSVTIE